MTTSHRSQLRYTLAAFLTSMVLVGCSSVPETTLPEPTQHSAAQGHLVSFDDLYDRGLYHAAGVGPTRWLSDGSGYTVLEASATGGHSVVRYHPETQQRDVLVAAEHLRPTPTEQPLTIADYSWSDDGDRKSTRLNSSHVRISYVVFCLK